MTKKSTQRPTCYNRIAAFMGHITYYSFKGQARLARDAGLSCSSISRLLSDKTTPSFAAALAVTDALSRRFGTPLDVREILSIDGAYKTRSVCEVVGCRGCAYANDGTLKPEYRNARSGTWSLAPPGD